jgi:TorA maturation chaperone TorD
MSVPFRAALERAHAFRTAARALAPPTDPAVLARDLSAWRQRADGALAEALSRAEEALAAAGPELADEHERLLGGRAGSVPARETSYADPRRVAPVDLADVAGFLEAFGLEASGAAPDHVCAECELASLLALKEAYALGEGWDERASVARRAYEAFVADHLSLWLVPFCKRLAATAGGGFYAAASEVLALLVREEARRLGTAVGEGTSASLPLVDAAPDLGCGAADTCAATAGRSPAPH